MAKQQRDGHQTKRAEGGPGSSHQGGGPAPGQPSTPDRSRTGSGGGERDRHHSHDPERTG